MIKILYVHGYKGDKYGPSFQSLAKYADAANFTYSGPWSASNSSQK